MSEGIRVKDVMSQQVLTVTPDIPVERLVDLGRAGAVFAVVMDKRGRPVGVVSLLDLPVLAGAGGGGADKDQLLPEFGPHLEEK